MVSDQNAGSVLAAAASVDLTPAAGLPLGGYIQRAGQVSAGTHDPLLGTLVWLRDDGGGEVLWVALDALAVDGALAAAIRRSVAEASGCGPDAVVVCASHSHSSVAGWMASLAPLLADQSDEMLRSAMVERLAEAARSLPAAAEPCRVVVAAGSTSTAGGNRNDPAGPHDDSVGVLALVRPSGSVAAAVVDYASHATVLGFDNLSWSADWPGAARRSLADALRRIGPYRPLESSGRDQTAKPPVVAVLQGAAGDASPRFVRRGQTFAEVDRLGGLVGSAALTALLEGSPDADAAPIGVTHATVTLRTRSLPPVEDARELAERAESSWRSTVDGGAPAPEVRIARTRYEGTLLLARVAEAGLPDSVEAELCAVRVGGAAWVHLPVELFASFGLDIRRRSPFPWTRVVGYSDGYVGYVADAAAHRAGVYESYASLFEADGGRLLADAAVSLLASAAAGSASPDPAHAAAGR